MPGKRLPGVDILTYPATGDEPLDHAAGADAFTIGTAAIDASCAPGAGPLAAQLKAVLADCGAAG